VNFRFSFLDILTLIKLTHRVEDTMLYQTKAFWTY